MGKRNAIYYSDYRSEPGVSRVTPDQVIALTPMQRVLKQKWPVVVLSTVDQAIELGRFSSGVGTGKT